MAIANRYAQALADVVGPEGDFGAMSKELQDFANVWRESEDLRQVLVSPTIPLERRVRMVCSIGAAIAGLMGGIFSSGGGGEGLLGEVAMPELTELVRAAMRDLMALDEQR